MELEGFTCALPEAGTADASAEAVATAAEKAAQPQQQQQQAEEQCASPAPTVLVPELAAAPASSLSVAFGSPVDAKPQTALPLAAAETAAGSWEGSPLPIQALEAGLVERAQHHEIATSPGAAAPPAIVQQQRHTLPPTPFDQAAQLQPTPFDQPLELDATGYEPTVTLSSREAFAAVNQMFGVSSGGPVAAAPLAKVAIATLRAAPLGCNLPCLSRL
jgi:Mrp family chromosome partitioning ATPase